MTSSLQMTATLEPLPQTAAAPLARMLAKHVLLLVGIFLLLSALYWTAVYAVAGRAGFPLDDTFIHLQYARSIWEGHPFEYNYATNPGVRSSGTSAPLWTIMLTGTYWLTHDWPLAAYTLGVLWTIPCVALVYWLVLRWTGKGTWAFFAAAILLVTHPTIISAYEGMEPAAYVATFLVGLLLYDFSRTARPGRQVACRLAASVVFAVGVWLRPEFLLMPVLIAGERALSLRREGAGWQRRWFGEMLLHASTWVLCIAPYMAFNKWISGTLLPNTYTIKALARNSTVDVQYMSGLPAAWVHRDWQAALRCVTLWQLMSAVVLVVCLLANNAVLAWRLPRAIKQAWRGGFGPAGLLAGICVIAFPMIRALVDPLGSFFFQFQRYFAHITPLVVILATTVLASRAIAPGRRLVIWAIVASLVGPFVIDFQAVKGIDNINDMQVTIAHWLKDNTPAGSVVATNDVGAIAFYSQRRVIDTVGLTEPPLGRLYMAGGTLEEYLRLEKPQYACLFPKWHDNLAARRDLFEQIFRVKLNKGPIDRNVICGGSSMWVLRTCWNKDFNPNWLAAGQAQAAASQPAAQNAKGK